MTLLRPPDEQAIGAVLHPTDLSRSSLAAFHHALALGLRYGADFTLLHAVGRRSTDSWRDFPSVRGTLKRWRAAGGTESFEAQLRQSNIRKVEVRTGDLVGASLRHVAKTAIDLIVVASEGPGGVSRLLRASRAETLARDARRPTLFVQWGARPFVSGSTGAVRLRRLLVPVTERTDPTPAMLFAARTAALMRAPDLEVVLLHVGDGPATAIEDVPNLPYCRWHAVRRDGSPVDAILSLAEESETDLVCMTTSWPRRGLTGVGGVTERIVRGAPCPVVVHPV